MAEIYKRFGDTYSICLGSYDPKTEKVGVPEVPVLPDYMAVHTKRQHLMCTDSCNVVINEEEEEEPTRCYSVFHCTYDRLNMFRAALCPSSGAHDYISDYHMNRLILSLLMVGG
jgi:hypothetical protein